MAFRANGSCAEITALGNSQHDCEIDGADPLTLGDGDASEALTVVEGGTTVWAWTGDTGDVVASDSELYRLDIPYKAAERKATKAKITTDNVGKAHLGSSVLYTLQLEDAAGAVASGSDGKNPASYLASLTTHAYVGAGGAGDGDNDGYRDTPIIVTPVPLTTDSDGKATITMSAPPVDPAPTMKTDKYRVTLVIVQSSPVADSNAPAPATFVDGLGVAIPAAGIQVVFSTEAGVVDVDPNPANLANNDDVDIVLSVKPASEYIAAAGRGASTRATVTVTDQYGDPITGAKVTLTSDEGRTANAAGLSSLPDTGANLERSFAVSRDGSYSFGYVFSSPAGAADTEVLTGSLVDYDHDGDGCSATSDS